MTAMPDGLAVWGVEGEGQGLGELLGGENVDVVPEPDGARQAGVVVGAGLRGWGRGLGRVRGTDLRTTWLVCGLARRT